MIEDNAVAEAVKLAGGAAKVAKAFGFCSPEPVYKWIRKGRVPPYRVLSFENLIDGKITRYELNPEIYPMDLP